MIPRLLAQLLLALLLLAGLSLPPAAAEPLRAGWYAGEPQQFIQRSDGREVLTGLDIEMVRAIAARAGHAIAFEPMDYPSLMQAVTGGTRDLATGVASTPDRAARASLSIAYRNDINVLILRDADRPRARGTDAAGLLADLRRDRAFRLGVRAGFSYIDPALDALIADPAEAARIRPAGSDAENLQRLLAGEIDGFLAERLSAALLVARRGARHQVEEAPLRLAVPLHLMFSPATPPATVAAFDAAIAALRADGTLGAIAARFRLPVLLSLTLGSDWFFALEMLGTIAAALAGYLAARQDRYSLFGALVLAGVTAVAAGVLRDLVVGRHPVGIAGSPAYLSVAFGTAILCYLLGHLWAALRGRAVLAFTLAQGVVWVRRRGLDRLLFEAADAVALAAFAVIGVAVALGMGVQPLWLWGPILGTLTGAGGGILRDIVRGGGHVATLRDTLYAEIALLVAVALSLYLTWRIGEIEQDEMLAVVAVAVAGGGALRMCVVLFGWRPLRLP